MATPLQLATAAQRANRVAELATAVRKAAPHLAPPPLPPPPPRLSAPSSLRPAPPPVPAAPSQATKAATQQRFASDHPYLQEWNRLMDAGLPSQYRTYGAAFLGTESGRLPNWREVKDVALQVEPPSRATAATPGATAYMGDYVSRPLFRDDLNTYGMATKRINRAGDRASFLQVYGGDPVGRPTILYSVPADAAEKLGLAAALDSLGYTRSADYHH